MYKKIDDKNTVTKSYIYLSVSLKDSFVRNGQLIVGFKDKAYDNPYNIFLQNLTRKTVGNGQLTSCYRIVDGFGAEANQLKIIIQIPSGWGSDRFLDVALKELAKNPSVDLIIAAYANSSFGMDDAFFAPDWGQNGKFL